MATILSTKILTSSQQNLILNAGLAYVDYEAIKIDFIGFEAPNVKNAIITSKNAGKAILKKGVSIENCFCVGEKTSSFLKNEKFKILETATHAAELANIITNKYKHEKFIFFCGNKRREELPAILRNNQVDFTEIEVYKTSLNFQKFSQEFDGILFFSPSAVKSFIKENGLKDSVAFCIGKTTASEAKKHIGNIVVATTPSIENVIVQVVKYFRR
ncbi:uroporphyrinogen-III synthase [Zunongwangia sp. H14]|uniref:uroporphyrinogen-III synthase n=1 Tax=Zunongwangia sp. H14 TaxID=3240792 RepID=UPI00356A9CD4